MSNLRSYDLRGHLEATMVSEAVGGNMHMDTRANEVIQHHKPISHSPCRRRYYRAIALLFDFVCDFFGHLTNTPFFQSPGSPHPILDFLLLSTLSVVFVVTYVTHMYLVEVSSNRGVPQGGHQQLSDLHSDPPITSRSTSPPPTRTSTSWRSSTASAASTSSSSPSPSSSSSQTSGTKRERWPR